MASFTVGNSYLKRKYEEKEKVDFAGYVTELSRVQTAKKSPVKPSKTQQFFDFKLNTETESIRAVCFSPQKRRALEDAALKISAVRIEKTTLNDKNEIMINSSSLIKSAALPFPFKEIPAIISTIDDCVNAFDIFHMVNLKVKVVKIEAPFSVLKDAKPLSVQLITLIDPSDQIDLRCYDNKGAMLSVNNCYEITNLRIHAFSNNRYLKTTETTKISILPQEESSVLDHLSYDESNEETNDAIIRVISVTKSSFTEKPICPKCEMTASAENINDGILECPNVMCDEISIDFKQISMIQFSGKTAENAEGHYFVDKKLLTSLFNATDEKAITKNFIGKTFHIKYDVNMLIKEIENSV